MSAAHTIKENKEKIQSATATTICIVANIVSQDRMLACWDWQSLEGIGIINKGLCEKVFIFYAIIAKDMNIPDPHPFQASKDGFECYHNPRYWKIMGETVITNVGTSKYPDSLQHILEEKGMLLTRCVIPTRLWCIERSSVYLYSFQHQKPMERSFSKILWFCS